MSKFEMMHFVRITNEYLARNNFRFYAVVEDGGVGIRYLSDDGLKWSIDYKKPCFKFYFYASILRLDDIIIEDFLTSLGLEIKLEMLME